MDGSTIIFLPIILFFGFFGLLIFGFLMLVLKLFKNAKNDSYTGKVVDKLYRTREDDDKTNQFFTLVVDTGGERQRKLSVSRQLYDEFKVGDKIKKVKGKLWPEKVNQ